MYFSKKNLLPPLLLASPNIYGPNQNCEIVEGCVNVLFDLRCVIVQILLSCLLVSLFRRVVAIIRAFGGIKSQYHGRLEGPAYPPITA